MTFEVKHPDGPADDYGDEDTYEFLNDGVLKVRVSSTGRRTIPGGFVEDADRWRRARTRPEAHAIAATPFDLTSRIPPKGA